MTGRHADCAGALPACARCAWRAAQAEFVLLWDTSQSRHRPERMRQLLASIAQMEDAIRAPGSTIGVRAAPSGSDTVLNCKPVR